MNTFHIDLEERWQEMTIFEQMANIGAEVGRSINWKKKGVEKMWKNAFYRSLELMDFTIADKKHFNSLKELCRMREVWADYIVGDNVYHSTDTQWEKYFYYFNLAARKDK